MAPLRAKELVFWCDVTGVAVMDKRPSTEKKIKKSPVRIDESNKFYVSAEYICRIQEMSNRDGP